MSVEKMEMVNIVGKTKQLDDTISAVIKSGCFHAESASELIKSGGFSAINDENPYMAKLQRMNDLFGLFGIDPELQTTDADREATDGYSKKLANIYELAKRLNIDINCDISDDIGTDDYLGLLENAIHVMQDKRTEIENNISQLKMTAEQLSHFTDFDFDVGKAHSSEFIHFRFGRMPLESVDKLEHYSNEVRSLFVPCSVDGDYCWGLYLAPVKGIETVDRVFASLFFERFHLPREAGTPSEIYKKTISKTDELTKKLDSIEKAINTVFIDNKNEFISLYSDIKHNYEIYETRRYAVRHKDTFILVGWIPEGATARIDDILSNIEGISVEYDDSAHQPVNPPTKLKNSFLFRPFQYFVEIFGVPSYSEIDPTTFLAVTYTLLYGIMFADLGQGLVLAVIGYIMHRFLKMPLGKILIPCGISGAVFGCVFGSVFGYEHWLDPLYRAIGFEEKPIDIMSSATYLLAVSIGIGVLLVIIAMFLNIASCIKRKDIGGALFGANGVAGIIMYVSLIVLIAQMFIDYTVNSLLVGVFGIALPALLIFLKEPLSDLIAGKRFKPESIGDFILINFFELFEVVLSYMTNTLSFLRVGAFVLIHTGMMTAFEAIASLFGGGIPSALMMVFGNVFVIALEGLLVGIQVLRLEFYEMFSRYYEGAGKAYSPLRFNKAKNQ